MGGYRSNVGIFIFAVTWMILIPLFCVHGFELKTTIGAAPDRAETLSRIGKVNVPFIVNEGQADRSVRYYAKTFGATVSVTEKGEIFYTLPEAGGPEREFRQWDLKEDLVGGRVDGVKGEEKNVAKVNYFIGSDPSRWKTGISAYGLVSFGEVYPGIEVKLRASGKNMEKFFYIKPGAEPSRIKLRLEGSESLQIAGDGTLEVRAGGSQGLKFSKPIAYQEVNGNRIEVNVAYNLQGSEPQPPGSKTIYGFEVGEYDKTKELVIDPLIQSTYLGGSTGYVDGTGYAANDRAYAMAIDSSGNVYVAGYTTSTNFPGLVVGTSPPIYGAQTVHAGGVSDAFISKFNPGLTTLLQSTYLGGDGNDEIRGIVISSDNVFVTGGTNSDNFPGIAGGAQTSMTSGSGGFVSRLNLDLTGIIQSTYLAGNTGAFPFAIAVSGTNVYVAGYTSSTVFPNVSGGGQEVYGGGYDDGFVSKLDLGLQYILQSTYLGGSGDDNVTAMVIAGGYLYLSGHTYSNDLPSRTGAAQPNFSGTAYDAFISKVNLDLTQIVRSTYLGGASQDLWVRGIAASGSDLYVVGRTRGGSIINTAGGAQPTANSATDAFVSKVNLNLTEIVQSTYLGGQIDDWGQCIVVGPDGNVYVAGQTMSSDIPGRAGGAYPNIRIGTGSWDGFVSKLNSGLTQIMQSTYLGGDDYEEIYAIALGPDASIYVAGDTTSINLPGTTGGAQIGKAGGYFDAFVSKFDSTLAGVVYVSKTTGCNTKIPCYNSIETLFLDYNGVLSNSLGNLVKMTNETYLENVNLNSPRVVTMEGGWNSNFTAVQTNTTIHGTLTMTIGTLIAKDLVVQ